MKIRTLLLGSAALAGLSTAGYAADLGVVTSLDVCDELGLSGLTISSDDNCLVITGNVQFEYDWGDYTPGRVYGDFASVANENNYNVLDPSALHNQSNKGDVDAWLKFVGTADSDFGPAKAVIKLISENGTGTVDQTVGIDEAYVSIGDTTILSAGYKGSIFNKGDDAPLNYLGLFNSSAVNSGVSWQTNGATTGGDVIQIVSTLGNGLSVSGGLEGLAGAWGNLTAVGVLAYAGDGISAHVSAAAGNGGWKVHAGFTGTWDPVTVVAAVATDNTGYWNALGSVKGTFDMFTLAASGEAASDGYGVGGSATAKVTDGVTINFGGKFWHHTPFVTSTATSSNSANAVSNEAAAAYNLWRVEAGMSAAVTETITLSAAVGYESSTATGGANLNGTSDFYGTAGLAWAPGGGFTSSSSLTVNSLGGYKAVFKAAKSIK